MLSKAAARNRNIPVAVVDSLQNSAAQGLLVMNANEWIQEGLSLDEVVSRVTKKRDQLKILVSVDDLDPMIDSGRVPQFVGRIAKRVNLKPIVSLNEFGEGKLSNFAFSRDGNEKKIFRELLKVHEKYTIKRYVIIHVNNEEKAQLWGRKMREKLAIAPTYIAESSAVIAMSAGAGSVAVAYELEGDDS